MAPAALAAALVEATVFPTVFPGYEDQLYPLSDDPALMDRAHRLHAANAAWADEADALVDRIEQDRFLARGHVPGLHDLRIAIARARVTVKMTPEESLRRYQRVQNGEGKTYHSIEELRRELGLPPKSRRSA